MIHIYAFMYIYHVQHAGIALSMLLPVNLYGAETLLHLRALIGVDVSIYIAALYV